MGMKQKFFFFFLQKNFKMATQNSEFFKIANSQKKIVKILKISPWVGRID
jgi:hypothetical protein